MIRLAPVAFCAGLLLAPSAHAADAMLDLTFQNHLVAPAELHVKAGEPLTLRVRNADATPEEFESKPLKLEKVVPGNGEIVLHVRPLKPGRYLYVGEYHEDTAKGMLIAE